jgi:hypothetical protein
MRRAWTFSILVSLTISPFMVSPARAQTPFYSGGDHDPTEPRAAAALSLPDHRPAPRKIHCGNPAVLVQPMLGAAHRRHEQCLHTAKRTASRCSPPTPT